MISSNLTAGNWFKVRQEAWPYSHMVTSVTHNLHPPETYAWEILYVLWHNT